MPWMPDPGDPIATGGGVFSSTQEVDSLSEISSIVVKTGPPSNSSVTIKHIYDSAGNLVFDGNYRYSYDAWNRLVQINHASLASSAPSNPTLDDVVTGDVNRHFTYDGLGRLIRTQRPFSYDVTNNTAFLSERYYYDGIRRIQEVRLYEVFSQQEALLMSEAPDVQQSAQAVELATTASGGSLEQTTTPMGVEAEQLAMSLGDAGGHLENPFPFSLEPQLFREYVYGPGNGPGGVDEIIAFYDGTNRAEAYFVLQDASGDVVALVDDNGPARSIQVPAGTVVVPTPRVVAQWTYDAYGQVLSADYLRPHPTMMAGHKGLFVERLDRPLHWQTGMAAVDVHPRLVPFAHLLYQNRNRAYAPKLGRFMQSDPNGTGLVALDAIAYHGTTINPHAVAADLQTLHTDGANLYQYVRSNPLTRSDPTGLYSLQEYWDNMREGAGLAWNGFQTVSAFGDVSGSISAVVESMVTQYSENLEWDADWTSDWSLPDDANTRMSDRWVGLAIARGVYNHFNLGYWGDVYGDVSPATAGMASGWQRATRRLGSVITRMGIRGAAHIFKVQVPSGMYRVQRFYSDNGGRAFVRFLDGAVKRTVRVPVSTPEQEIIAANRHFGKRDDYDWVDDLGVEHTWHHDDYDGVMQLVPTDLHGKVGHQGGRNWRR